jgi:hypothetical protein
VGSKHHILGPLLLPEAFTRDHSSPGSLGGADQEQSLSRYRGMSGTVNETLVPMARRGEQTPVKT